MEKNSPYCALQSDSLVDAVFHDAMTVLKTLIELNKNSSRVQMRKNLRKVSLNYHKDSYFVYWSMIDWLIDWFYWLYVSEVISKMSYIITKHDKLDFAI